MGFENKTVFGVTDIVSSNIVLLYIAIPTHTGNTPKATKSDNESICTPKSFSFFVLFFLIFPTFMLLRYTLLLCNFDIGFLYYIILIIGAILFVMKFKDVKSGNWCIHIIPNPSGENRKRYYL